MEIETHHGGDLVLHAIIRYPHPGDSHLFLIIVEDKNADVHSKFVVWTYNKQDGGFHNGYYNDVYWAAVCDFAEVLGKLRLKFWES